ncbi:hypothetical protein Q1695_003502 [Nippostrongylus brasiliensis]|nr:hypothetical protein Q1695_003502 [Nippostrongylus brasiliensis]
MDSYRKTIIIENGRITAGFPFTNEVKNLKDNFNVAVRRLQNLLRILQADQEKFTLYDETLTSYLQEGIIEEAKNEADSLATFYLPHRHVWTPTKSTKLRVVFDASSHAKDELSLNDVIYEGHSLTPLIHEVLLKFRTHLFTMVADIQKAFLQIRLPSSHRDVTRFLWVKDILRPATGNNLKTLRFCRVPFGINASPAILNQCILKHIEGSNSEISQELSSSLYVDNVFLEGNNADDLLAKYYESKKLFSSIGMNLRDYLSNSANVNRSIPESDRATSIDMKVLGIQWNALGDSISLKCVEKQSVKVSKRTILSQINGYCFDPLGLLTPLLLPAKIFLQDLHKKKSGWDAPLSEEDETTWRAIHAKINGFEITLPRKVMEKKSSTQHTLSVFVDSSKRAYACSIYVTTISCSNRNSRLFTAKSKIAPINKEQTIPRLELLSIFIGLSLAESTIERINTNFDQINVFTTTLSWFVLWLIVLDLFAMRLRTDVYPCREMDCKRCHPQPKKLLSLKS